MNSLSTSLDVKNYGLDHFWYLHERLREDASYSATYQQANQYEENH